MGAYKPCMDCQTPTQETRCPPCASAWRMARDYSGAWPSIRAAHLQTEPICRQCGARATEVDHIRSLRDSGTHAAPNLQSLCHPCHMRKTVSETRSRSFAG